MKRCSASLVIWEMQIKATLCHFIPIMMTLRISKENRKSQVWVKIWRNWNPRAFLATT